MPPEVQLDRTRCGEGAWPYLVVWWCPFRRHPARHHGLPGPARPGPRRQVSLADWLTQKGTPMADIPEVLFVCTHNAGRSQMAAASLDHRAGRVRARSAGSRPRQPAPPAAVQALAEISLDISREYRSHPPPESSRVPTLSSRWAAATPARSTPASA